MAALIFAGDAQAYTCDCKTSGNWSNTSTWQNCGGGIPGAADDVTIKSGRTVTVDITTAQCDNLQLSAGGFGNSGTLVFNAGSQLTMSGTLSFFQNLFSWASLDMSNGGTLNCAKWTGGLFGSFSCGTGKVKFTGTSFALPWNLFMLQFYDLEVATSGNLNLVLGIEILNDLTISSGTLNAASFDIDIGGNWNNTGGSYSASNNTVTFNGTGTRYIRSAGSAYEDLTINKSSGNLNLLDDVTINDNLGFSSGHLILDTYDVTMNTISGAGTSRHIVTNGTGNVQKPALTGAFTFPVSNSTGTYNPLTLNNSGTSGRFDVRACTNVFDDGTCGGTQLVTKLANVTWQLATTSPAPSVSIIAQWDAAQESSDFDRSQSFISIYNGGSWNQQGSPSSSSGSGPYTQSYGAVSALGPVAVGGGIGGPLPIELLSMEAVQAGKDVLVNWTTASEINNHYFTLESATGSATTIKPEFHLIGTIPGSGNSTWPIPYSFLDTTPSPGQDVDWVYYRLWQTDLTEQPPSAIP
ncbi:MAG: G8 domain-containing protein [Flavobacteriales bacterium]|nr:G8 domain-containing protein [Flavobacteriales bacterium]